MQLDSLVTVTLWYMASDDDERRLAYKRALKAAHRASGLKIKDLAELVGVSSSYISQIESPKTDKLPSGVVHSRLVAELGDEWLDGLDLPEFNESRNLTSDGSDLVQYVAHGAPNLSSSPNVSRGWSQSGSRERVLRRRQGVPPEVERVLEISADAMRAGVDPYALGEVLETILRLGIGRFASHDLRDTVDLLADILDPNEPDLLPDLRRVRELARLDDQELEQLRKTARFIAAVAGEDEADPELLRRIVELAVRRRDGEPRTKNAVAFLPPGERTHVWANAIGVDDEGRIWLNPDASQITGSDRQDPAIGRDDEGRYVISTSRMDPVELKARDRKIHTWPLQHVYDLPGQAPELGEYARTVLAVQLPNDGRVLATYNRADAPQGARRDFPGDFSSVHIVSAANPSGHILAWTENKERQAALLTECTDEFGRERVGQAVGLPHTAIEHPGPGSLGNPRIAGPPAEPAVALFDLTDKEALQIARRHGQESLFRWTDEPMGRAVLTPARRRQPRGSRARSPGR